MLCSEAGQKIPRWVRNPISEAFWKSLHDGTVDLNHVLIGRRAGGPSPQKIARTQQKRICAYTATKVAVNAGIGERKKYEAAQLILEKYEADYAKPDVASDADNIKRYVTKDLKGEEPVLDPSLYATLTLVLRDVLQLNSYLFDQIITL